MTPGADLCFDDSDDCDSKWSTSRKPSHDFSWRRLRPGSMPGWLPIGRLHRRSLVYGLVVLIIVIGVLFKRPVPEANNEFCTTWPVAKNGTYDPEAVDRAGNVTIDSIAPAGGWRKPAGLKVIAMVFYGRKRFVDIMDCYLQQNLASNGGYLDEVWFMAHTTNRDDMAWLEGLVLENPDYRIVGQGDCENRKYNCMWRYATGDKTIYVKIDDDIVYIHPDAIPQLVHTRVAVPHPFAVSANLVNSPITGLEQYHHGAIHPFVADPKKKPQGYAAETWRPSQIKPLTWMERERIKKLGQDEILNPDVAYRGMSFRLASQDHWDLIHTPLGHYDQHPDGKEIAFGAAWTSWAIAAQQQYSLLYNLEKNWISRYFFGRAPLYPAESSGPDAKRVISPEAAAAGDDEEEAPQLQLFDTQYRRYNLNFCAVWGSDIRAQLPIAEDDEEDITSQIPKQTGRPFVIDTRAVVGHFSFFTQIEKVRQTDLLDRWRALANEAVCEPLNRKAPWDLPCPRFNRPGGLGWWI
ncbi:hypothetical protein GGR56DRAFT_666214 [Xylariaceae sp. FL0804]|nr:hypothetical protein GGR56DRAFT_666214 [Xylariaceae sp. FL0804]